MAQLQFLAVALLAAVIQSAVGQYGHGGGYGGGQGGGYGGGLGGGYGGSQGGGYGGGQGGGYGGGYGGSYGGAQSIAHFSGPVIGHAQPIVAHDKHGYKEIIDYVAHPHYKFLYDIADHHTGDFHGQEEVRDGHDVQGHYGLKEPSGGERSVKYVSTPKVGFLAEVHTGKIVHPTGHKYGGYESHKYGGGSSY